MKRIVASVGLMTLGAVSLQAAMTPAFSGVDASKPWSASLALRGFYDDNPNTVSDGEEGSYGFEVNPTIGYGMLFEQTAIKLAYSYSGKYYENRPLGSSDKWDHTHTFDAALDHIFNERFSIGVRDSFVIGQEPDVLRAGDFFTTQQRISGDNIRNSGSITLNAEITPVFGVEVGYANAYFNYDNEGENRNFLGMLDFPSNSGVLDRIEHTAHIDGRWQVQPDTTVIAGYQFRQVGYTADEVIGPIGSFEGDPDEIMSDDRNSRTHYGYAGVEHRFRPDLTAVLKGGVSYTDFYNDPSDETDWSPYVQGSIRYSYGSQSYAELGVTHDRHATDLVGSAEDFVRDVESTVVFGTLYHQILPSLFGRLVGTFQNSTFNGGGNQFDDESEMFFLAGVDLEYRFNEHFSAHAGYNYDRLDSDVSGRSFTRNRVYIGVTASY